VHLRLGIWGKFGGELVVRVRRAKGQVEVGGGRWLGAEEDRLLVGVEAQLQAVRSTGGGGRARSREIRRPQQPLDRRRYWVSGEGSSSAASSGEVTGGRGTFI